MERYLRMSSAAVVIGALRVKHIFTCRFLHVALFIFQYWKSRLDNSALE